MHECPAGFRYISYSNFFKITSMIMELSMFDSENFSNHHARFPGLTCWGCYCRSLKNIIP